LEGIFLPKFEEKRKSRERRDFLRMSEITINLSISKVKSEHSKIRIVCPFCRKIIKSYHGLRLHLSRNHSSENGIIEVKRQASKLYRMYRGSKVVR